MLTVLDHLPDGLLTLNADQLHTRLNGPTLIHLPGRRQPAMFLCVLLHGNEHTSWEAARRLLAKYQAQPLPRALSLFIGNVEAARYHQRFLDYQPDFNRIWGDSGDNTHPLAKEVLGQVRERGLFLSVDVHNNTGKNPHYACVNVIDPRFLHLARLFSRTIVYFVRPHNVQSMAFAQFCPSVTVECGLSGDAAGIEHVYQFLEACLHLTALPDEPVLSTDIDLYHTVAIARVDPGTSLGFAEPDCAVDLDPEIEFYNFREIAAGTPLGRVHACITEPLVVTDESGLIVTPEYLYLEDGQIKNRKAVVPAMITRDISAIRKDCFCYFMERYPLGG